MDSKDQWIPTLLSISYGILEGSANLFSVNDQRMNILRFLDCVGSFTTLLSLRVKATIDVLKMQILRSYVDLPSNRTSR
jgi:hypothetical protein